MQGTREDVKWDEEPGKIVHEVRPGVTAGRKEYLGLEPDGDELRYYGSADGTSWFLHVLAATGDAGLAAELEAAWRAAGDWVLRALERGGGLVRFARRAEGGLVHQGWRDTTDPLAAKGHGGGLLHADGSVPPGADRRRRHAGRGAGRACAAWRGCRATRRTHGRPTTSRHGWPSASTPRRWRSTARTGPCAARARSSDGCCGPASRSRAPPSACHGPTCSPTSGCARCRATRRCSTRSPITAGRSGRSTRGWGGAGCARRARPTRPSACAPACCARSPTTAATPSSTRSPRAASQRVPIANRVQAWTVGAAWALENEWDGGAHVVA